MNILTWLHISDLHFQSTQAYDAHIVLKVLFSDITELMQKNNLSLDFIVATGDIAFSGKPEQYFLAEQFFNDLLNVTNLPKDRLFIVPGNHDIDRSLICKKGKEVVTKLINRDCVNRALNTSKTRRFIFRRFAGYSKFINNYFSGKLKFDDENYFYVSKLKLANQQIALLGLNTAWLCSSKLDKANGILIGELQTRLALERAECADLLIALLHHPLDWLYEFDQNDSAELLNSKCDFILHGHLHRTKIHQLISPDNSAMIIACGACYNTRNHPNTYNIVRLDFKTKKGTVYLRRYSDQGGGFWAKDILTYKNVPDGLYTFELDRKRILTNNSIPSITPLSSKQKKNSNILYNKTFYTSIEKAHGVVIGDNSQIKQKFFSENVNITQPGSDFLTHEKRCNNLAEIIIKTRDLIKKHEERIFSIDNLKRRDRNEEKILDLKIRLAKYEKEYQRLNCESLQNRKNMPSRDECG